MLQARLHVRQDVDIWSLGCVLSEVLTWSVYRPFKLLEYRHQRQKESEIRVGREAGYAFHDSHMKLNTVSEIHSIIKKDCRVYDQLYLGIVELIDNMMQESGSRSNATFSYMKLTQLIKNARREATDTGVRGRPPSLPLSLLPSLPPSAVTTLIDEFPEPRSTKRQFSRNVTPIRRPSDATPLYLDSVWYPYPTHRLFDRSQRSSSN